ncbi:MAG TPA: alpha/beta hydrolase [Fulvivirga sp.]|nr:alpha/beta hydrolase [Fulvivirga sp.]
MEKQLSSLLVLHGALGSAKQMQPFINHLPDNLKTYTMDFTGHGGLALPNQLSIELFAKEVSHFLDVNNINLINIFGYSMGGYVALKLALTDKRIKSIYTLGTKFNWTPESAKHETGMLNPDKIELKVPAFAQALKARHFPTDWRLLMNKTSEMMLALGEQPALTLEHLRAIAIPVIIGIGDQDTMVSIEESQWAANHLPNGSVKIFKGFKHPIEQLDNKKLAEAIAQFIHSNS